MKLTRREPIMVLLFSVITCGIYYLYWIYKVTEEMGYYLQNDNNAALDLILCIFCMPYTIYWMYKMGKQVWEALMRSGKPNPSDNSIIYLILTIFGFGIVAALIMQDQINGIAQ